MRTVIAALEQGIDVHAHVAARIAPTPAREDIDTVLRILQLDTIAYRRGEPAAAIIGRVMDLLESVAEGEAIELREPERDGY
ncbi:hypothetical protein ACIP5Y_21820 [Nocardia sp. NPDC088792]|uniref:hypothetical protein n=1 Tax=Nocardia sp. NPDC088792 TaxID=3364332 RepID=UPI0037F71D7E